MPARRRRANLVDERLLADLIQACKVVAVTLDQLPPI